MHNARIGDTMRFLSPLFHGFVDVAVVLAFLAAPALLDFNGAPKVACYVVASVHAIMSLLTAFPLGIVKVIPFTVHGTIEAIVAPSLLVLPWILRFSEVPAARNFFLVAGVAVALTWRVTNYLAAPTPAQLRRAHLT